ncbi:hypothetical protein TBLA_0D03830 [Henningerozyma blattae CBS 6284]|uniref:Vps72/YL1 C-terminal domain-containing protein n=1 Tax=Henningerozyma blattae (strain ATCC 34711 / CBS 6284 / DSM 70876 / NBRC 10599 / NRRL Y-10934 / UCD 77-7) TaxID=1071380 RepID=I2H3D0_HENB6|nr:hypothetical protein TBLA_0D03830 [Tetrapisispora blattae CBS 6284]CCH60882.1 hypothetical protein TBLA_0D03830 [Tetrapisispora blattae CBS 6284]
MSNTPNNSDARLEFLRSVYQQVSVPNIPSNYRRATYIDSKKKDGATKKKVYRRHRTSKQLIADELKRINKVLDEHKTSNTPVGTQINYFNINAPPSLKPIKKYCDITGLVGNYKSSTNNLRYYNSEIYQAVIKQIAPGMDQEYLKLRGDNFVLK